MIDSYGRKINYARISITDLCNLRCSYCMPADGVEKKEHGSILRIEEVLAIADALAALGIQKIRLTGGEPLVRRGMMQIVRHIGGMREIEDFAMTTNGLLLPRYAQELAAAGLNRVNISLDSLVPERFTKVCGAGKLETVMQGIEAALDAGLGVKLNVVLMDGFNTDEIEDFCRLTLERPMDVRFIELMPIGACADWAAAHYASNERVLDTMPALTPTEADDASSPAVYYRLPDAQGRVGLIRPLSCKFCAACNRIRITADGRIKTCLHSDEEIDIRALTGDQQKLRAAIESAVLQKPLEHTLNQGKHIERNMFRIGG